jgi:hypothetical protein
MQQNNNIKAVVAICLSLLIAWVTYNVTVNTHYHLDSNGMLVKHAHPYESSEHSPMNPTHTHSTEEMLLLVLITDSSFGLIMILVIGILLLIEKKAYQIINTRSFHIFKFNEAIFYRGPPVLD